MAADSGIHGNLLWRLRATNIQLTIFWLYFDYVLTILQISIVDTFWMLHDVTENT